NGLTDLENFEVIQTRSRLNKIKIPTNKSGQHNNLTNTQPQPHPSAPNDSAPSPATLKPQVGSNSKKQSTRRRCAMSSEQQIEANRLNAQKSTGPSTPEGRAAVGLNGLKYGLYANTLILPGEDPAEFDALLDRFHAEYQPATPTEETFVSQIVMATWRRARIQRMEVAVYESEHKL